MSANLPVRKVELRKVLIVRSAFDDIYEPAWNKALNDLGIESQVFQTHEIIGSGLNRRIQERLIWGPGIWRANRNLIKTVREMRPDVVLFYQGQHFYRKTIERLRSLTFVTGYHNDDLTGPRATMLQYRLLHKAITLYHGYHVYRECNLSELLILGVPRVKVLMSFYLPWFDYPRDLSNGERYRWGGDIVFAGHPAPDLRIECLSSAARSGLCVKLYGYLPFWRRWLPPDVKNLINPQWPITGDNYRKALCGAKIAACFLSKWNRDQYTRRVFEIPACGVFLLSERTAVMQSLYEEGREAEYFDTAEEFLDKAKYYLKNDTARQRIAEAGYRRATTSGYDIYSRMKQWLADVAQWREELVH